MKFEVVEQTAVVAAVAVAAVARRYSGAVAAVASFALAASFLFSCLYLRQAVVIAALEYWRHCIPQMTSRIGINFLPVASPFVVTFSTILPAHSAYVDAAEEQFFQSSFVVHCSLYHFAIHRSTPGAAASAVVAAVVAPVLAVTAVEA